MPYERSSHRACLARQNSARVNMLSAHLSFWLFAFCCTHVSPAWTFHPRYRSLPWSLTPSLGSLFGACRLCTVFLRFSSAPVLLQFLFLHCRQTLENRLKDLSLRIVAGQTSMVFSFFSVFFVVVSLLRPLALFPCCPLRSRSRRILQYLPRCLVCTECPVLRPWTVLPV
jgi:hypothetical protein